MSDRVDVLGVGVDPVDKAALFDAVGALIVRARAATVAYANVHVINVASTDAELRAFLRSADLVYCDGAGVRLGARLLGTELPPRMTGADWIWDLAERAAHDGWRIFWLGGEPGVTERAADRLRQRHPALVMSSEHGFHEDTAPVLAAIRAFRPHILLVGMGTPLQERWVARHRAALPEVPVVWVLGATADFVSGKVSRGPRVLYDNAEWLSRLLVEPRRLWRRYLLGNTAFLLRVARARLRT
jgi:N-acetylglucosaminyldiphosphoundecaprenol N-acetyl-beta-D-mannosaminyltransferase